MASATSPSPFQLPTACARHGMPTPRHDRPASALRHAALARRGQEHGQPTIARNRAQRDDETGEIAVKREIRSGWDDDQGDDPLRSWDS